MKMRSVTPMRIAKMGYIIMSIIFCVVGVLFIACPELSVKIIGKALGIISIRHQRPDVIEGEYRELKE